MFDLVPFRSNTNIAKRGDAFDRLFNYMLEQPFGAFNKLSSSFPTFKVDVKDNGDAYELTAELPGVSKADIGINYEHDYLTISANRNAETEEKNDSYVCKERHTGHIERSFYIDNIDDSAIKAQFKEGILTVTLPKRAGGQLAKQINID